MTRIQPVDRNSADPAVVEWLDSIRKKMGMVPNLISTMAQSPAVAKAYVGFSQTLSKGTLPPRLHDQLSLAVGEMNGCDYCVAAHTASGKGLGMSEDETLEARRGVSRDPKENAALEFALELVTRRGRVSDADLERVRAAGFTDGEIGEIVAHVALNIFSNYFNLVAQTDVDFPSAPELAVVASAAAR